MEEEGFRHTGLELPLDSGLNITHDEYRVINSLTKSPESWIDAVGSVSGSHDDDVGSLFQTIHQSQQLGDNAPLNLSVGLKTHTLNISI